MNYHIKTLPFSIHKGLSRQAKFDKNGVILSKIPYTQEWHYHLTSIASYVLDTQDENNLQWIKDNLDDEGIYRHDFVFPHYPMEKGWVGGLAQGLAISALIRNYETELGKKALAGLKKYCMKDDIIYEYPNVEILNGWIYALFGVYDAGDTTTFYKSLSALKDRLDYFITSSWSLYDSYYNMPSTVFYHEVVMEQLKRLFILTQDDYFLEAYMHLYLCCQGPLNRVCSKLIRGIKIIERHKLKVFQRAMEARKWKK